MTSAQRIGRTEKRMEKINDYICVDLETTGLNPKTDRIIEIGAVKVRNGEVADTFESLVNPGRPLEERIINITGIRDDMLTGKPFIRKILPDFLAFAGEDILLGHSVLFDFAFLKKAVVNEKGSFERMGVDTLKIARCFLKDLPHRSLPFLSEYYGIPHTAHRALSDAMATTELYDKLWQEFGDKEGAQVCFTPKPLLFQVKKDAPITPVQKERLYKLLVRHKLNTEYNLDTLTRSEASRYTDRILAKYGR